MKLLDKRIAYYLKKVAQFGAIHPSKARNPYRSDRLLVYKKLMHKRIKEGKQNANCKH